MIEAADRVTMSQFVRETVGQGVSLVATDEYRGSKHLDRTYPHQIVNHSEKSMCAGTFIPTISKPSGVCSSEAWSARSIRSAKNICRCTLRSFRTATITGRIQTSFGCHCRMLSTPPLKRAQMKFKAKHFQLRLPTEVSCRRLNRYHSSR